MPATHATHAAHAAHAVRALAQQSVCCVDDVGAAAHDSREHPWFLSCADPDFCPTAPSGAYVSRIQALAERLHLPPAVKYAYLHVADPTREFTAQGWTWMGVDAVEQRVDLYEQHGQLRLADLAFRSVGMGHVEVLALDRSSGRVVVRHDGGSNDWERAAHWQAALALQPEQTLELEVALDDSRGSKI